MPTRTSDVQVPGGRTLTVYESGRPDGKAVFYLGGTPSSGLLYEPHVRLAERQGVRLISFDRSGYGRSTPHPGRSVIDVTADIASVADALGIERFVLWGVSGGGPHALACAARLADRVAAVASLASVAPYPSEGLDWLEGMGESNIEEFGLALQGRESLRPWLEREARELLDGGVEALIVAMRTLLGAPDVAVLSGRLGEYFIETAEIGIADHVDGWADDDLAFVKPWGFDLAEIDVPVLLLHGRTDRFVPFAHGEWLAEHVPGAEARLTEEDGHLTLFENRVEAVHDWLLARF